MTKGKIGKYGLNLYYIEKMYIPKYRKFLNKIEQYFNHENDRIVRVFVKFFMCIPNNSYKETPNELFKEEHYLIFFYFLLRIKEELKDDKILALIFTVYIFFVDDEEILTDYLERALDKMSISQFSNICIQMGIDLSEDIFLINKNDQFVQKFKETCLIYPLKTIDKEISYSLKEINIKIDKSLYGRSDTQRRKSCIVNQ